MNNYSVLLADLGNFKPWSESDMLITLGPRTHRKHLAYSYNKPINSKKNMISNK